MVLRELTEMGLAKEPHHRVFMHMLEHGMATSSFVTGAFGKYKDSEQGEWARKSKNAPLAAKLMKHFVNLGIVKPQKHGTEFEFASEHWERVIARSVAKITQSTEARRRGRPVGRTKGSRQQLILIKG